MAEENLRRSLEQLRTRLGEVETEEQATQQKVDSLTDHIQDLLTHHEGDVPPEKHRRLLDALRGSVEHFEINHPVVTGMINNVIQTMNNLGI